MRSNRRRLPTALLVLAAPFWLHCAAIRLDSPGERLLAAGNLARAAEAFERDLVGSPSAREAEEALFHLAVIYASPGATFDPMLSSVRLDRLLERFPQTRYKAHALLLRDHGRDVARLEMEIRERRQAVAQLTRDVEACQVTKTERDDEIAVLFQMGTEEAASRRSCEVALASLRRRVNERDEEIGRLHDAVAALEALRRIDTERKPGG